MYYLSIDIGASSGRHILAHKENGTLKLEEIYRFKNQLMRKDGHFFWDLNYLYESILKGMKECYNRHQIPISMAIDTWGVDYTLTPFDHAYGYRDQRCDEGIKKVQSLIDEKTLYQITGIQFQPFNTIYQLATENLQNQDFLMIPDYFNYRLTGKKNNEYTNFSTTGLLNANKGQLDEELLNKLHLSLNFPKMLQPGDVIGFLSEEVREEVGFNTQVVACASHDTGSAYMASLAPKGIILSSGTWSLLGVEENTPIINKQARLANFTNEGGYGHTYRFLKNIMGMWIIQEVARLLKDNYSFAKLQELAPDSTYPGVFDVNDQRFLAPLHMIKEIQKYFFEKGEEPPKSVADIAYCVYHSLALSYKASITQLENIVKKTYKTINIIGGGSQNFLLNEMIEKATGKKVIAGPIEATAIGNILAQMIASGAIKNLEEGRRLVKASL